jgi:hypothetical protein
MMSAKNEGHVKRERKSYISSYWNFYRNKLQKMYGGNVII